MRKAYKLASLAAMGGALLQFGGCWGSLLTNVAVATGTQFFIDNGGLFDLFVD